MTGESGETVLRGEQFELRFRERSAQQIDENFEDGCLEILIQGNPELLAMILCHRGVLEIDDDKQQEVILNAQYALFKALEHMSEVRRRESVDVIGRWTHPGATPPQMSDFSGGEIRWLKDNRTKSSFLRAIGDALFWKPDPREVVDTPVNKAYL